MHSKLLLACPSEMSYSSSSVYKQKTVHTDTLLKAQEWQPNVHHLQSVSSQDPQKPTLWFNLAAQQWLSVQSCYLIKSQLCIKLHCGFNQITTVLLLMYTHTHTHTHENTCTKRCLMRVLKINNKAVASILILKWIADHSSNTNSSL